MTPQPLLLNKSGFELFSQAELEKWGSVLGQLKKFSFKDRNACFIPSIDQ